MPDPGRSIRAVGEADVARLARLIRDLASQAGLVLRNVRLIFDRTTRPESNLVLGEVVHDYLA